MAAKLQTMRSGGAQHPEEIVNFMMSQLVSVPGVYDLAANKLLVTQETVPAMSVKVAQGAAFLKASGANMAYPGFLTDADASVAISSNSSGNPRKDAIVLYVDKGATPNADISNVLKLVAVEGTPAGSPTSPDNATIQTAIGSANPFLRLADVTVASGAVSILNASILDTRVEMKLKIQVADPTLAQQPASKNYVDGLKTEVATHAATGKTTPVDADEIPLADSAASFGLKKLTWANLKATIKTYLDAFYPSKDGWQSVSDAWSYAGADAPTFTITVPSGAASIYAVGQRIKLTQTTVKYFIITAVADTVLTVYGGTDYTLANAAISAISYSLMKAPLGFPLSPDKWSVETTDTQERVQNTPAVNTWYNNGSKNIILPIGEWDVSYQCLVGTHGVPVGYGRCLATLSTGNNTESDAELTAGVRWTRVSTDTDQNYGYLSRQKNIAVASKTTMYMNQRITEAVSNPNNILFENHVCPLVIRAVCAYL